MCCSYDTNRRYQSIDVSQHLLLNWCSLCLCFTYFALATCPARGTKFSPLQDIFNHAIQQFHTSDYIILLAGIRFGWKVIKMGQKWVQKKAVINSPAFGHWQKAHSLSLSVVSVEVKFVKRMLSHIVSFYSGIFSEHNILKMALTHMIITNHNPKVLTWFGIVLVLLRKFNYAIRTNILWQFRMC